MIDKKKKYEDPEVVLINFSYEDIITLSLGDEMNDNEEDFNNQN